MKEPVTELPESSSQPPAAPVKSEIKICPSCHRKLLTQTSILCNWCGEKIDDPDFLERAAAERTARDEQERHRVESVAQEEAQYGIFGRLKRMAKPQSAPKKPLL